MRVRKVGPKNRTIHYCGTCEAHLILTRNRTCLTHKHPKCREIALTHRAGLGYSPRGL